MMAPMDPAHTHTRTSRNTTCITTGVNTSDVRITRKFSPRVCQVQPVVSEETVSVRKGTGALSPLKMILEHKYLGINTSGGGRRKAHIDDGIRPMDLDEDTSAGSVGKVGAEGKACDRKVVKPHPHKRRANPHKRVLRSRKRRVVQPKTTQTPEHAQEGTHLGTHAQVSTHEVPTRGQKRRRMTVTEGGDSDNTSEVCRRISRLTMSQLLTYEGGTGPKKRSLIGLKDNTPATEQKKRNLREPKTSTLERHDIMNTNYDTKEHKHNTRESKHAVPDGGRVASYSKQSAREERHHTREKKTDARDHLHNAQDVLQATRENASNTNKCSHAQDVLQATRESAGNTHKCSRSSRKCRIIAQAVGSGAVEEVGVPRDRKPSNTQSRSASKENSMRDSTGPPTARACSHDNGEGFMTVVCAYEGCRRKFGTQSARAEHVRKDHRHELTVRGVADRSPHQETESLVSEPSLYQKLNMTAGGTNIPVLV
ncbi:hypothetical protein SARC_04307 [Sphaeroforma arctica JP610]|uniref:C2H2-type domain-containing protein n=1 Tax=Sphaeroforma arctica JP610 TaxID=667725 RepID=A0A0L0G2T2_9EUKA|nr:hypothetical protein SARC_04307 [Sphaeroforma arctica JP610]KNC83442.1 hypothetical protein SARC_04307 [Sphaeroforma arctica JP610]|eukprot:XP_014157344.1 hypothetical protein SARC_04307 [Sphaeroforma arctica JP610]